VKTWCGGIAPPFLPLALDGDEWSSSRPRRFTPRPNRRLYPLSRKLGGPQSRSGHCGEEKNLARVGNETPPAQPRSPSLYRLRNLICRNLIGFLDGGSDRREISHLRRTTRTQKSPAHIHVPSLKFRGTLFEKHRIDVYKEDDKLNVI
jgi:hypothetical protein